MKQKLVITVGLGLLSGMALLSTPAAAQAVESTELRYDGYGPENFANIYRGNWAVSRVGLSGELFLPEGGGPFPVVVLRRAAGGGSRHAQNLSRRRS